MEWFKVFKESQLSLSNDWLVCSNIWHGYAWKLTSHFKGKNEQLFIDCNKTWFQIKILISWSMYLTLWNWQHLNMYNLFWLHKWGYQWTWFSDIHHIYALLWHDAQSLFFPAVFENYVVLGIEPRPSHIKHVFRFLSHLPRLFLWHCIIEYVSTTWMPCISSTKLINNHN